MISSPRKYALSISTVLCFMLCYSPARGNPSDDSSHHPTTGSIVAASLIPASAFSATLVLNYVAFWKYAGTSPEHWSNDPPYAMHVDKLAHCFFSWFGSDVIQRGYIGAGLDTMESAWLGAGLTLLVGTAIETEDGLHGYSPEYGFSPGDWAGDLIGSSMPLLKRYFPSLNRFTFKISLWPSDAYNAGAYHTIADDYESQYFWLSADVHDLVTFMPPWLNVTAGYSAENLPPAAYLAFRQGKTPASDVYLSLDINLKGIPIQGALWSTITDVFQYIRIPFPSLQVYPRTKFWALR